MFTNSRCVQKGVGERISERLQALLWSMIDDLGIEKNHYQAFYLKNIDKNLIKIIHMQEEPNYLNTIQIEGEVANNVYIFVIDQGESSVMMYADAF